jgi:hypothetical protein
MIVLNFEVISDEFNVEYELNIFHKNIKVAIIICKFLWGI